VNCGKTADSIEMLFGVVSRVGPINHVLDARRKGAIFREIGWVQCNDCHAKTAELIEMPFEMVSGVVPKNRVLDVVHIGATLKYG